MKIEFRLENDKCVKIIEVEEDGLRKQIGTIFTPSSSAHNNTNAIQVCGFEEAFDLWGCAIYEIPAWDKEHGLRRRIDKEGKEAYEQAKDIQLVFNKNTRMTKHGFYKHSLIDNCFKCYNDPCTCELKIKGENPYAVKREQDLHLEKNQVYGMEKEEKKREE